MDALVEKATGALAGAAVGDALGGAAEGNTPEAIQERYDGFITGIVPPFLEDWRNARPIAPYHKGDGHVTDDTLMTTALVDVYDTVRGHLDAYAIADHLVPLLIGDKRWIPEFESEGLLLHRIFLAEKWLVTRLHYGHIDPREAGVGNIVNCGATMYVAPIGIVNAGCSGCRVRRGHRRRRRPPVQLRPRGGGRATRPPSPRRCARVRRWRGRRHRPAPRQGRDPRRHRGRGHRGRHRQRLARRRSARSGRPSSRTTPSARCTGSRRRMPRIPSRTKSIEELPIALGMLDRSDGDYRESVLGLDQLRSRLRLDRRDGRLDRRCARRCRGGSSRVDRPASNEGSRIDVTATGPVIASVARDVWAADAARAVRVEEARGLFAADLEVA